MSRLSDPPESVIEILMKTSFNHKFMSREEAIEEANKIGPALREQREHIYGKYSCLYFHASDKLHNYYIREKSGGSLCFLANKPEAALAVAKARHNWNYDFCFLHVCKLNSYVNLFNPQSKSDIKKVSLSRKELEVILDLKNWLIGIGLKEPERWWRICESKFFPSSIKKVGFLGITLNFWDMTHETPGEDKTEGIAIYNGNQMKVHGIKVINQKDEYKNYDEYLKNLKTKEELEKEYKSL